jgi:hypothetical protein
MAKTAKRNRKSRRRNTRSTRRKTQRGGLSAQDECTRAGGLWRRRYNPATKQQNGEEYCMP